MQKLTIAAVFTLVSSVCIADVSTAQKVEVAHLLQFVKDSACIVNRNGSEHDGASAAKHMKKKYKHFEDDIQSTEDFIRLSATKSTMSGKYYQVKCPGKQTVKTQDWLLAELKTLRTKG